MNSTSTAKQANYDTLSRWYDWFAGPGEEKAQHTAIELLNAQPGEHILEIGFGTGRTLLTLAQAVQPNGVILGADLSDGMCRVTQDKIKRTALKNICLCQADALNLPYRAHSVDTVLMSFTLELFATEEIPVVLHKCRRVLKENGRICITAMSNQGKQGLMSTLYQWGNQQFPHIVDCHPINLCELLVEANFTILQAIHHTMWGLPITIALAQPNKSKM